MPTIETCGSDRVRTTFTYRGSVQQGITLEFESGDFVIDAVTIQNVLNHFQGQQVRGGFSMTDPTPGGVGEYLATLGHALTPRHASFLCAALRHEGFVNCELNGNAVIVTFNA